MDICDFCSLEDPVVRMPVISYNESTLEDELYICRACLNMKLDLRDVSCFIDSISREKKE